MIPKNKAALLYRRTIKIVEILIDGNPTRDSDAGVLLRALADAVVKYEKHKYPHLFLKPRKEETDA